VQQSFPCNNWKLKFASESTWIQAITHQIVKEKQLKLLCNATSFSNACQAEKGLTASSDERSVASPQATFAVCCRRVDINCTKNAVWFQSIA